MNFVDIAFKNVLIVWSIALAIGLILLLPTFLDIYHRSRKQPNR